MGEKWYGSLITEVLGEGPVNPFLYKQRVIRSKLFCHAVLKFLILSYLILSYLSTGCIFYFQQRIFDPLIFFFFQILFDYSFRTSKKLNAFIEQ